MGVGEAIRRMMEVSGMNAVEVSRAIGRSDTYVSTTLSKGSIPQVNTLAAMAEAMGFELALCKQGVEIRISVQENRKPQVF